MQVAVTNATCLESYKHFARSGQRNRHFLNDQGFALSYQSDCIHFVHHKFVS